MGAIQSSVNSIISTAAVGLGAAKRFKQEEQENVLKEQENVLKEQENKIAATEHLNTAEQKHIELVDNLAKQEKDLNQAEVAEPLKDMENKKSGLEAKNKKLEEQKQLENEKLGNVQKKLDEQFNNTGKTNFGDRMNANRLSKKVEGFNKEIDANLKAMGQLQNKIDARNLQRKSFEAHKTLVERDADQVRKIQESYNKKYGGNK